MYRDDEEAARALADKLRRDNAALEDEKAELSNEAAELADDNAALRRENERLKAQLTRGKPEPTRRKPARARGKPPSYPSSWRGRALAIRVGVMLATAGCGAGITTAFYPGFHDRTSVFAAVLSALLNQLWGQSLLAQAVLGWMPDEDRRKPLAPRWRLGTVLLGLGAIFITALFIAFVGESRPD
jgi:hypothetical protein